MKTFICPSGSLRLALATMGGVISLTLALHAQADSSFRCETGRLVSTGDRMAEVRAKCGEPDFVTQTTERRKEKVKVRRFEAGQWVEVSEEREVDVAVDEWTYDMGPHRFVRHVRFENAKMTGVTTGGYGTKKKDDER